MLDPQVGKSVVGPRTFAAVTQNFFGIVVLQFGEEERNSFRRYEEADPTWKQYPVVDVSSGESKVYCSKEQYNIGTWNDRSMNQGKLEVVKQEMARGNIDILGISELKWTGMGDFNSDAHYIYYCG